MLWNRKLSKLEMYTYRQKAVQNVIRKKSCQISGQIIARTVERKAVVDPNPIAYQEEAEG